MNTTISHSNFITSIYSNFTDIQHEKNKETLILVPCALGIDHKTDECLRILEHKGYQVWRQPGYSAIDQCRNKMIYNFLKYTKFKRVLWIDGDIIFNPEDVEKLENSGYDIVGATYPFKGFPQLTFVPENEDKILFGKNGERFVTVQALATGFLMISRRAIENIIAKLDIPLCNTSFDNPSYPLFTPSVIHGDTYIGEDFGFCSKATQCGYKIYLDTTIHLKHVGRYEYSWSDVKYKIPYCDEIEYELNQSEKVKEDKVDQDKVYGLKTVKPKNLFETISTKLKKVFAFIKESIKMYDKEDFN